MARVSGDDWAVLEERVLDAIWLMDQLGEPITVRSGPGFDKQFARALDLRMRGVNQGDCCVVLNRLVEKGLVRKGRVGEKRTVFSGRSIYTEYPVVVMHFIAPEPSRIQIGLVALHRRFVNWLYRPRTA